MAGKKRSHSPEEDDDEDVNENMENGSEEMEVDVDEDDDRRSSSRSKKHKKKKKVGLMQQSGQTEADRRILRKKQRELHQEMVMGNGGTTSSAAAAAAGGGGGGKARDGNDELFAQWREQNNELYNEVRYTREAVLDSENIDLIASKAAREAEKIVQVSFNVCLYMFVIFFHMTRHIHSHSPLSLVAKYNVILILLIRYPVTMPCVWLKLLSKRGPLARVFLPDSTGAVLAFRWACVSIPSPPMFHFYTARSMPNIRPRNVKRPNVVRNKPRRRKVMARRNNPRRLTKLARRRVMGTN